MPYTLDEVREREDEFKAQYGMTRCALQNRILKGIPLDKPMRGGGRKRLDRPHIGEKVWGEEQVKEEKVRPKKLKSGKPGDCVIVPSRNIGRPEQCNKCPYEKRVKCLDFSIENNWNWGWEIK